MSKPSNNKFDVLIVGSGPAGVHAAYPLVEAGLRVAIIDGGLDSKRKDGQLLEFPDAKITKDGHYYDFIEKSSYVFNNTYDLLRVRSNVEIFQSLAKGGLSEIWHGICDFYTKDELRAVGLPVKIIEREYDEVAKRIKLKRRPSLDFHSTLVLAASKRKKSLEKIVYPVPLAFPYRTRTVIDDLKRFKNFTYIGNQLVVEVCERGRLAEVQSFSIDKRKELITKARFLILAAGSINSTRILLRSFGLYNYKTTFLTKANYLMACFHPRALFKKISVRKLNSGQVVIFTGGIFTQLYRLNPLMLANTLKYVPLPKFIALPLLSLFASSLEIADVRFSASESKKKYCMLKKGENGKDVLDIWYEESSEELKDHKKGCDKIMRELVSLGLFPLKTVKDHISSHYAGGVPVMRAGKLSVNSLGRLHQARRIYVADSATWRVLPAKSPTLTIMANASRIGKNVLRDFNKNTS